MGIKYINQRNTHITWKINTKNRKAKEKKYIFCALFYSHILKIYVLSLVRNSSFWPQKPPQKGSRDWWSA